MEEALSRGRGVILSIGHLGNWELAGMYLCDRFQTLNSVYRPLDYPPLDRLVLRIRNAAGMTMVPRDRALPHVIRVLKRKGVAALLTDQDAKGDGVFVDFFGRPASTLPTPAALSTRFGTPIVPVNIYREGARLRIEFDPPIWPEAYAAEADPQRAITQEVVKRLEGFIRLHPEQWFWLHRRWKTQPPGA
jgi:KDO2-lipid IV(A) lauroyltransferase